MELYTAALPDLEHLRRCHAEQMHGPTQPFADDMTADPDACHLALRQNGAIRGYASLSGPADDGRRTLLEVFVEPGARAHAVGFVNEVIRKMRPASWELISYDRFGLALAWNCGYIPTQFSAPILRTPAHADVGMVVTASQRRQGLGVHRGLSPLTVASWILYRCPDLDDPALIGKETAHRAGE